jgi:tRNA(fMet)-specific endonuclease VapC
VARRFASPQVGEVAMSLVTYGELRFGAEKSFQRESALETLERLTRIIPVILPDERVGEAYGALRVHLERAGTPIGNNDLWIAAQALALDVTLVSNNCREFERVPGITLENWVS